MDCTCSLHVRIPRFCMHHSRVIRTCPLHVLMLRARCKCACTGLFVKPFARGYARGVCTCTPHVLSRAHRTSCGRVVRLKLACYSMHSIVLASILHEYRLTRRANYGECADRNAASRHSRCNQCVVSGESTQRRICKGRRGCGMRRPRGEYASDWNMQTATM